MTGTERLLTGAEVAEWLRVDPKTVSRWASRGKLPSIQLTPRGLRRYRRSDLMAATRGKP